MAHQMTHQKNLESCTVVLTTNECICERLGMCDMELSNEAYLLVCEPAELGVFLEEHPYLKVDLYKDRRG
jgi:hypothetical protein